MNILLVHDLKKNGEKITYNAVNYYRMQKPLAVLSRLYPEIDYITAMDLDIPDHVLQESDLVLFSRVIPEGAAEKLNKLGLPFGLDLDDHWYLDDDHILTKHYATYNISEMIIRSMKEAHFVTCTTEILAGYIKEFNPNVFVIENGIDTDDENWKPEKYFSDRLRFGFMQGEAHMADLMQISKDVARSFNDPKFYHQAQVVLAGWRVHDHVEGRKVSQYSVQIGYERELTKDLEAIKFEREYVHKLKTLQEADGSNKPYRRFNSLPAGEFGQAYDHIDISVVPLRVNTFCSCKSNIKMLEAGFKDCGVIVSAVTPYTPLATSKNSFLLSQKNFFEWQRYILNNPHDLEDRKAQLAEDVKPYSLNNLSKKRKEIYESCKRLVC